MKFDEWLKVYSFPMWDDHKQGIKVASYDAVGDMHEAWDIAKADCLKDWISEKEKSAKYLKALAEIANIFTSETDPTRACHRIQAIVNRHKDRGGRGDINV